ncbi:GNAT family N-acetyltransferase [Terribacillus saccharophilus]|uniref:GNAT family N-acetyltransferase n=1 Tax=Terribacillus saccharophilus TaxID=361277 RepID=UPI002DC7FFDF|nr:GNAT family N-acetyltransferase [Terribacillus saccharophilus]
MSVIFKEMNTEEVEQYIEFEIPNYAENVSANLGIPKETALKDADTQLHSLLTEEKRKKDHFIGNVFCEDKKENVGIIWYNIQPERDRFFIFHIYIHETFRRMGYASAALTLLEEVAKQEGIGTIALNVFANNAGAQHVYNQLGYETVSMVKTKKI